MLQGNVIEKIKIHIYVKIFFPQNCTFYAEMWKNMVEADRLQIVV